MHPDVAWSDGAFGHAADAMGAGSIGVLIPSIRTVSESSVPEFQDLSGNDPASPIVVSGKQMMELAMRHMHPLSISEIPGMTPSTAGPDRLVSWISSAKRIFLRPAVWSVGKFWDTPINNASIQRPIRFHYTKCTEPKWAEAEQRSAEIVRQTLKHRQLLRLHKFLLSAN